MATQEEDGAAVEFHLPLNSRRLTRVVIGRIAQVLDVPTTASTDKTLQMIEAKLCDRGKEPHNVQVIQGGAEQGSRIALEDDTGTFLEISPEDPPDTEEETEGGAEVGIEEELDERGATLREELARFREQTEALKDKVRSLQEQLSSERSRYKCLWKINEI